MKANELMIGDWVLVRPFSDSEPVKSKITAINYNSYRGKDYTDWVDAEFWDELSLNQVEPIPLTPEILEKNGFGVQDQGGGRKDVWTGFGVDCEGDIEVEFQYNIPIHLKIDGGFKGEYYTSANIKYIHQLQHALRLCGIDKTIEL